MRRDFFMPSLQFQLQHTDKNSKARAGTITIDHGEILTPIFMPVGTVGSVKAVTQQQLLNNVMDIQRIIGGDIIMAFDECPPGGSEYDYAKTSMELTHRWLDRCFKRFSETSDRYGYTQNLFPIVQGGVHNDLRKISCEYISS